jgi:hypothetical protein
MRIEVRVLVVYQRAGVGLHDTRDEAVREQAGLRIAAVRIEAVTDDAPAVALDVGDDGHDARGHLGKIDVRVADRGRDRHRRGMNRGDFHAGEGGGAEGRDFIMWCLYLPR